MSDFDNGLIDSEVERLAILAEECGEVIQIVGKVLRHRYASHNPLSGNPISNRGMCAGLSILPPAQERRAMMNEELKPCPFCGAPGGIDIDGEDVWAICTNPCIADGTGCAVRPCTVIFDTESEAIAAWNLRSEAREESQQ